MAPDGARRTGIALGLRESEVFLSTIGSAGMRILATMAVLVLTASVAFDLLVRHEYRNYRKQLEQDGRPWKALWPAQEAPEGDGAAWKFCGLSWLWRTPAWVRTDAVASGLLWLYRGLGFTLLLGNLVVVSYRFSHL